MSDRRTDLWETIIVRSDAAQWARNVVGTWPTASDVMGKSLEDTLVHLEEGGWELVAAYAPQSGYIEYVFKRRRSAGAS